MKLRLDKETEWKNGQPFTMYYIWADERCIELAYSEEEALLKYENVKANYVGSNKQILKEEEI
jgi:hypothetical protein